VFEYTYLATAPAGAAGPHTIQLTASGQNPVHLTVTVDGVVVITATDSSPQALPAAGRAGIFDYNGVSQPFRHFTIGP
jgi:hypothetical protein